MILLHFIVDSPLMNDS